MPNYNPQRGYERSEQGKFAEKFFLGEIPKKTYLANLGVEEDLAKEASLEENFEIYRKTLRKYQPHEEDIIKIIKKLQPSGDPTNPKGTLANKLLQSVKIQLIKK